MLLRNEGDVLPLAADSLSSIAVIGPLADSQRDTLGPWIFNHDLTETVTILDGIRARVGDGVEVAPRRRGPPVVPHLRVHVRHVGGQHARRPEDFDDDAEIAAAAELARGSDVAIVVAGEWQNMIGESASRSSLELPGRQLELIQAVVATGTPVVLLVMNGRPLDLRWPAENVPAILDVWYPGSQGGHAVAALVFGDDSPAGKLPFSWPRTVGQVPISYSHTRSHEPDKQWRALLGRGDHAPLPVRPRPRLRRVLLRAPTLSAESIAVGETLTVSVTVTNTGERSAEEVVQLYLHQRYGTSSRPVRELKGFERVAVAAGASVTVEFTLGPDELRYWSAATRDWVQDATTYDLGVGTDSTVELATTFDRHRLSARG